MKSTWWRIALWACLLVAAACQVRAFLPGDGFDYTLLSLVAATGAVICWTPNRPRQQRRSTSALTRTVGHPLPR